MSRKRILRTLQIQATMANKDGLAKEIELVGALFSNPFNQWHKTYEEALSVYKEDFLWLDEIFDTLCTQFTSKKKKLEQMPKTPSAKAKMQNRKRKNDMIKIEEESSPKLKVTRLKFEEPVGTPEETGRPVRKCRASKTENNPTVATKQTRSKRQAADSIKSEETPAEVSSADTDQDEVIKRLSEETVNRSVKNNRKVDESSPSVRTRIKNYEDRIISPASRNGTIVCTPKTVSSKKMKTKASISADEKEQSQDCPVPPKQARTRLRLKKQMQDEPTVEKKQTDSNTDTETTTSSAEPGSSEESDKEESEPDVIDSSLDHGRSPQAVPFSKSLSETEVVISEVYELSSHGSVGKLRKYDVVQTKTSPATKGSQPQADNNTNLNREDLNLNANNNASIEDGSPQKDKMSRGMSTRTRTRAKPTADSANKPEKNKDSGVIIGDKANSTFTTESESGSDEGIERSARTRTRGQKGKEAVVTPVATDEESGRGVRTRQRVQEAAATKAAEAQGTKQGHPNSAQNVSKTQFIIDKTDEKITGSPATHTQHSPIRGAKRVIDHGRGLSPAPKRARSNMGDELKKAQPLSTSSPIKNLDESEMRDTVSSASMASRPFKYSSAHRNGSSFFNRTPSFCGTPNSSHLSNLCRGTFLSKASPSPQRGPQNIFSIEQKKRQLAEKNNKDKERLRRVEEKRKQDLEKRKREREERFQRVAASRQEYEEKKKQQDKQFILKHGTTAAIKAKLQEEKEKEEAEKRRLRQQKQMEADLRRKQEEEERLRRLHEQEEEARQQEALFLKKRKQEEMLRKQKLAEEKARNEERLAEKEQRLAEEKAKFLQQQREKELLAEKARVEKENQLLQERLERERLEREKRAEKERKLKEDIEQLKAMEQERLYLREQELQKQREMAEKELKLKQVISNHNKSILAQKQQSSVPAKNGVMNTTQTLNTNKPLNTTQTLNTTTNNSNSYEMTPAKIYTCNSSSDYGLDDKESDDSTDDEDAPKKRIPEWATGIHLTTSLIKQCTNPPDLEKIFLFSAIVPPDLEKIFKGKFKKRYKQRTSSAIWNTPPIKNC